MGTLAKNGRSDEDREDEDEREKKTKKKIPRERNIWENVSMTTPFSLTGLLIGEALLFAFWG